MPKHRL